MGYWDKVGCRLNMKINPCIWHKGHFHTRRPRFPHVLSAVARMRAADWTLNGGKPITEPSTLKIYEDVS